MNSMNKYLSYRKNFPIFNYNSYCIRPFEGGIDISYDFSIEGLCSFKPEIRIETNNFDVINAFDSRTANKIVFYLGLAEAVSYLKPVCPPVMRVHCGYLDEEDKKWWQKLYYKGLSEFLFINGIKTDIDNFIKIECLNLDIENTPIKDECYISSNSNLIPVGGGKDSAVTAELMSDYKNENWFITINSQKARTDTVVAAGYNEDKIIKVTRTISQELLDLNKKGFFNGHTPFSSVVAFVSLYCAYLIGANDIVLSNEASANEPNMSDSFVNHQYSKSVEFEYDFQAYVSKNITDKIFYFSILRPFNELQISKMFSNYPVYHNIFRSCNQGSRKNIWCGECAKCLFVYSILSPFISRDKLIGIFGSDMFEKGNLLNIFEGLTGIIPIKPFECVGTIEEIIAALSITVGQYKRAGIELPLLLKHFVSKVEIREDCEINRLFLYFNKNHKIPEKFTNSVEGMYSFVSTNK